MGRLTEVNQSTVLGLKLFDGATDRFPRVRIYNSSGAEMTAAPFNSPVDLSHVANGLYRASITPDAEGEYFLDYRTFSEGTYTTLDKKYEEVMGIMSVRSVDQDLATMLSRLTSTRAGNLDNLDATVSSRSNQASVDIVDGNVDSIKAKTDQIAFSSGRVEAEISSTQEDDIVDKVWDESVGAHTALGTTGKALIDAGESAATPGEIADAVWNDLTVDHMNPGSFGSFLDGKVSIRETEAAAASRHTAVAKEASLQSAITICAKDITVAKEGTLQLKASQESVDALSNEVATIRNKTDNLTFESGRIVAKTEVNADKAGYELTVGEKANIADRVWDEAEADHQGVGSTGAALTVAKASSDPAAIADAVWDETANDHVASTSMGGKLNTVKNQADAVKTDTEELKTRLSLTRAANLDNLDQPISSRESETSAASRAATNASDHDLTQAKVDSVIAVVGVPSVQDATILQILQDATYGLAQLRIQLDAKASSSQFSDIDVTQDQIKALLEDGSIGLAAIVALIDLANTVLGDSNYGLARLRTEIDTKATQGQVTALPTAVQTANRVWDTATAQGGTGTFGEKVRTLLDAAITSRASQGSVDTVDTVVDAIKALLEDGTIGLQAIVDEINENEVKIDTVDGKVVNVDGDLAAARSDILTAIAALVDGTPTILAALDVIKGAGWSAVTDTLKKIRDAIGAGSATLANQTTMIAKLDLIHGTAPGVDDNIVNIRQKVDSAIADIDGAKTQIITEVNANEVKIDQTKTAAEGAVARLDNVNYGLAQAKADRDSAEANILNGQTNTNSKIDTVEAKVDNVDGDIQTSTTDILNAIANQDSTLVLQKLNGIIALLQDGGFGLSTLASLISTLSTAEASRFGSVSTALNTLISENAVLKALIEDVQGTGFISAAHSLEAIKASLDGLNVDEDDLADKADVQALLNQLNLIKDGNTNTFVPADHNLKTIATKSSFIEGFEAGETE